MQRASRRLPNQLKCPDGFFCQPANLVSLEYAFRIFLLLLELGLHWSGARWPRLTCHVMPSGRRACHVAVPCLSRWFCFSCTGHSAGGPGLHPQPIPCPSPSQRSCLSKPNDPAIPLLGTGPGKNLIRKDTCTPVFTAPLFTITKTWKQTKCPSTEEWIKM